MKTVYCILADNGDGSQRIEWYKGSEYTREQLESAAEADEYSSYASGDGVQITTIQLPDIVDLDDIKGMHWQDHLPGVYDY